MRRPLPQTLQRARDLANLADEEKSPSKVAEACRSLGYSLLIMGEFRDADEILARGAAIADAVADREFTVYGEHPSIVCRIYGGQARMSAGFPESAAQLLATAVGIARRQDNAHSLAWALNVAAHVFTIQKEPRIAMQFASEALAIAHEHSMSQWIALGERCKGWALHCLGYYKSGLNLLMQGIKRWNDTGAKLHKTHCELALVDCLLREGRVAEARVHLGAARSHYTSYAEAYMAAEMDLLEALLLRNEHAAPEMVESHLAKSLNTAREQSARLFELRTARTYAEVLAARDEHKRAFDTLAPIYYWFTEGSNTTDLRAAKMLLDALTSMLV